MAGRGDIEESTTLEARVDMKGPTTPVASMGMTGLAAPERSAERKDPAAETTVTTDFTAVRCAGLQSRTPKLARILARLVGTTMGALRAATRIGAPQACTAGASREAVFMEAALAAAVD